MTYQPNRRRALGSPEGACGALLSVSATANGTATIRTALIDNEPWFVAADVCRALHLRPDHTRNIGLSEDEMKVAQKTRCQEASLLPLFAKTDARLRLLSESGLYKLIIRSDKKEALEFQHWIASEVLPSIRKTGMLSGVAPASAYS